MKSSIRACLKRKMAFFFFFYICCLGHSTTNATIYFNVHFLNVIIAVYYVLMVMLAHVSVEKHYCNLSIPFFAYLYASVCDVVHSMRCPVCHISILCKFNEQESNMNVKNTQSNYLNVLAVWRFGLNIR